MSEIKNAVISEVFIGADTQGMVTGWITVNFGLAKQGFGGLDFSLPDNAFTFIGTSLKIVGVSDIKDLVGKAVRVDHDTTRIYAMGNFIEDVWYRLAESPVVGAGTTALVPDSNNVVEAEDGTKHHSMNADPGIIGAN